MFFSTVLSYYLLNSVHSLIRRDKLYWVEFLFRAVDEIRHTILARDKRHKLELEGHQCFFFF